jgi:hypothetical protein
MQCELWVFRVGKCVMDTTFFVEVLYDECQNVEMHQYLHGQT